MEILQNIDTQTLLIGTLCVSGLCLMGAVLSVLLQFIGFGLEILLSALGCVGEVIAGGPIAWCGCLTVLLGCAGCSVVGIVLPSLLQQCGGPNAVNLCRFLGY